eukprot:TRINITY_DN3309_c0_g1_i1.p1 TRINITY_DN3309_c0_g1~~TRINITY_DN3309_c0_g1_i1.p1  ORF type:complete len:698 (-),score=87.63 TRINITY_DN3309_c0_g1_i1:98-2191(-)
MNALKGRTGINQFRLSRDPIAEKSLLEGASYAIPLDSALEPNPASSRYLDQILSFLKVMSIDTPDLFSETPQYVKEVNDLRSHIEASKKVGDYFSYYGCAVVAEFMKQYLDTQSEPIIPVALTESLLAAAEIETPNLKYNALHSLTYSMPPNNRHALQSLVDFLSSLVKHSDENDMTIEKITQIFGPALLRSRSEQNAPLFDKQREGIIDVLVANFSIVFVKMDEELQFMPKDGRQLLGAAYVDHLVEKLVDPYYKETEFMDIVLLTHVYFTTSLDLLNKLIEMFIQHNPTPLVVSYDWRHKIRTRILQILHKWIMTDYRFLSDEPSFISRFQNFTAPNPALPKDRSSMVDEEEATFGFFRTFLATLEERRKKDKPMATRSISFYHGRVAGVLAPMPQDKEPLRNIKEDKDPHEDDSRDSCVEDGDTPSADAGEQPPNESSLDEPMSSPLSSRDVAWQDILQSDPNFLAEQLTLIDNDLFLAVSKRELLKKRFMTPSLAPNFTAMVHRFNRTGEWVSVEILGRDTAAARANIITQFVRIAMCLRKLNSFNSLFGILGGLNSTPITRLKLTWEKVPRKETSEFKKLMKLIHTDGNYQKYRHTLLEAKPPLIPYLALISRDLFVSEDGNATFLEGKMVNFAKMRMIWRQIQLVASYQVHYSAFTIRPELRAYLKTVTPIPENDQYELSYKLEPRRETKA